MANGHAYVPHMPNKWTWLWALFGGRPWAPWNPLKSDAGAACSSDSQVEWFV